MIKLKNGTQTFLQTSRLSSSKQLLFGVGVKRNIPQSLWREFALDESIWSESNQTTVSNNMLHLWRHVDNFVENLDTPTSLPKPVGHSKKTQSVSPHLTLAPSLNWGSVQRHSLGVVGPNIVRRRMGRWVTEGDGPRGRLSAAAAQPRAGAKKEPVPNPFRVGRASKLFRTMPRDGRGEK